MITSHQCVDKYGQPDVGFEGRHMTLWRVPNDIKTTIHCLPTKIYCNKDIISPLEKALRGIAKAGLGDKLKTFDGCFNVRKKRGSDSMSLHSWGIALDFNASWNQMGKTPTMDNNIVKYFVNSGFIWGGNFSTPDGMHFELAKFIS